MKKITLFILSFIFSAFLLGACTGIGSKSIELTPAQKDSIEKIKQDSINHAKEQKRINDSIKHIKDSLQAIEHRKQHIAEIDKLLKECEISRFEDIASFNNNRERIASAIYSEKEEKQKSKWTSALKAVQIRNFPKARRFYIQKMKNEMWINDVKVYGSGASITFVSYIFSTNSNIQSGYQSVRPSLEELRFKRVNFKWAEYNEYTYYTIDSPSDGVI